MTDVTKYNAQRLKTEQEIPATALMEMTNNMIGQLLQMVSAIEPKDMNHQQMIMQAQNALKFVASQVEPAINYHVNNSSQMGQQSQQQQQQMPPNFGSMPKY